MPTTRHSYCGYPSGGVVLGLVEENLECSPPRNNYSPWQPSVSNEDDPIAFGSEVFAHHSMPDGTPLTTEELRYLADIIVNDLKKGEQ